MAILLAVGAFKAINGNLHAHSIHQPAPSRSGTRLGWLYGATVFVLLKSFASGGSPLTGTEAISNGVSIFRRPEARNARITMVSMSLILGSLVLGVSTLAPSPTRSLHLGDADRGLPDRHLCLRPQRAGQDVLRLLQASTVLILVLAPTPASPAPVPRQLAAADSYLPAR